MTTIEDSISLPCGLELPNRLMKGAMTEGLADEYNRATEELCKLYRGWSNGGTGLLVSGNVMVDRRYMEGPGNLAIDGEQSEEQMERLKKLAAAGKVGGSKFVVQLGHGGRQSTKLVNMELIGPSAIAVVDPRPDQPRGAVTRAMTKEEIQDVRARFKNAARVCKDAGFDGVQLHSAHGYLLSSFFNPLANKRTDEYGGSLENRARLLLEILEDIIELRDENFAICVKINSSDFQHGGFTLEECAIVVSWLDKAGVDLIEISGGNYEEPVMLMSKPGDKVIGGTEKRKKNDSTIKREAYFLDFATMIRDKVNSAKLCVTGGFRTRTGMDAALQTGDCDFIGIGRPLCVKLDASKDLLERRAEEMPRIENLPLPLPLRFLYLIPYGNKAEFALQQAQCYRNIHIYGLSEKIPPFSGWKSLLHIFKWDKQKSRDLLGVDCDGYYTTRNKQPSHL